ncbi:MAG TPA: histidine kinase dimerization/phospho-acceptor domain-containing protein, partial [Candidatus Sulfotelmatobacter sp.]|nr:histidine kinase dimerization/phospho-acceptor domain-containing protein [Candidatus Sulfotelmatobacter sp.]
MSSAIQASQALVALGFVALGVATLAQWYRSRDRAQAMLAWSLGLLAVTAAVGRIEAATGPVTFLSAISLVAFLASGYFVLLFRDAFLPLSRTVRRAAAVLLVVSSIIGIASLTVLAGAGSQVSSAISLLLVLTWCVFILEPVVRFWRASRSQPSVQRSRMRALSFAFIALMAILLVSVLGGAAVRSQVATLVIQLIALAIVPVIYVSFAPPSLLRRIWRMGEENKLRAAIQDLLIFSPGPQALAEQAVGWAIRLMGAQSAFIVNHQGDIIASRNIGAEAVQQILARRGSELRETLAGPGGSTAIVVPMPLTEGAGCLGVVSGAFTPVFGNDEINQLEGYASSVAAGIERTRVTERIATIERHKTQFLNLASHELRGPLTVIRGYGSMLQSGLLGDLNERGRRAAPVMMAK